MKLMPGFTLTKKAKADLKEIAHYTQCQWGATNATSTWPCWIAAFINWLPIPLWERTVATFVVDTGKMQWEVM